MKNIASQLVMIFIITILGSFITNSLLSCTANKPTKSLSMTYDDYQELWKVFDGFQNDGKYQDALKQLGKIEKKATEDANDEQLLKSFFKRLPASYSLSETPLKDQIRYVEDRLKLLDDVGLAIAQSYLADLYNSFYQQNRYKISKLTNVDENYPDDLDQWTAKHFITKSNQLFRASIAQRQLLNVPLSNYNAIIESLDSEKGVRLRSTIYDLLAHRAVDYFGNVYSSIIQPTYAFEFDQEEPFFDTKIFRNVIFETRDSSSSIYNAVQVFQQLENNHAQSDSDVLLDIILKRLVFANQHSTTDNKNTLYKGSLEDLYGRYKDEEVGFLVLKKLLELHVNSAQRGDVDKQNTLVEAMKLMDEASDRYTEKFQVETFDHYRSIINRKELSFSTEEVVPIKENILAKLSYKNIDKLSYKIYSLDQNELKTFYKESNKPEQFFKSRNIVLSGDIEVPINDLYGMNETEFIIDGLSGGAYFVVLEDDKSALLSWQLLLVSNLGYSSSQSGIQVFDRITGKAVRAKMQAYQYAWSGRKRTLNDLGLYEADRNGIIKNVSEDRSFLGDIFLGEDHLFLNNYMSQGRNRNVKNKRKTITSFTDRSIYRPGQKVYFKAIAESQEFGNDPILLTNQPISVKLMDANYQLVETLSLKTNDFGSINGQFVLPTNLLNGTFRIQFNFGGEKRFNNQVAIKVEEYKRPKFSVKVDKLKGEFMLDQSVTVHGTVESFSGSAIDNATVRYYITRTPIYRYYYRGPFNGGSSKVIKRDETKTDGSGKFTIDFIAEKDKSSRWQDPVFNYAVTVEVTDNTGETRSTTKNVRAGAKPYIFQVEREKLITSSDKKSLSIKVQNQNSVDASLRAKVEVFKLNELDKNYRTRYWSAPKNQHLSERDFSNKISKYQYLTTEAASDKGTSVSSSSQEINGTYELDLSALATGKYKVVVSHPDAVDSESIVQIVSEKAVVNGLPFIVKAKKDNYQPGEVIEVDVYSAYPELQLQVDVLRHNERVPREYRSVKTHTTVKVPVNKSDRGGIQIVLSGMVDSRFFQEYINIKVPYDDKDLTLKWETFRSDIYPGSEEKWRLTLKDKSGSPVVAEVLSSMYDASLDAFNQHKWNSFSFNRLNGNINIRQASYKSQFSRQTRAQTYSRLPYFQLVYPMINTETYGGVQVRGSRSYGMEMDEMEMESAPRTTRSKMKSSAPPPPPPTAEAAMVVADTDASANSADFANARDDYQASAKEESPQGPALRKNLNETVFFMPELKTNNKGETVLEFTMNEALTEWKLQTFAHTKDSKFVLDEQTVKTSKDLMVFPNGPRFFRHGDRTSILAKIQNNTEESLLAKAYIKLINPLTNEDVTDRILSSNKEQNINVDGKRNTGVSWEFEVPADLAALTYQVYAESGEHIDGEENTAIVLTNRKLITESLAITIAENSTKKVEFDALDKMNSSLTLESQLMDVSVTSNPSWLAIQSLPYLMEYPYKCSEQIFSRYFGNSLARHILDKNPIVETVYKEWSANGDLESALSKNQDLKSAVLEQTPWVMDALNEEEQMARLANLFDRARIMEELGTDIKTLVERQNGGGFPWFPGGRPNWYITQHILEGIGQLQKMGVVDANDPQLKQLTKSAIAFIDAEFINYDNRVQKHKRYISPLVAHYMYVRSFYLGNEYLNSKVESRIDKYVELAKKDWKSLGLMSEGHLALYFDRNGDKEWSQKIVESLRQRTIYKENLGRYWKEVNGYNWNQSNIEKQALMIAAFDEIGSKDNEIDEMKHWLLSNKQTNRWKSTKATTQAIYAIIERGEKWIANDKTVTVKVANESLAIPADKLVKATGQYSVRIQKEDIDISKKDLEFNNENSHVAWGSVSYQYWEDLDKIEDYQETPLQLKRAYFKKVTTDEGMKLIPLSAAENLKTGELLTVRLSLVVDRPMEFIHLQDMRAAGTEPIDVLSSYRWQSGLGYYMETRDVATNFFVDYLPTGEYTFEYDQRVVQPGEYSAGVSTIQSMYAPEFGAHSQGAKLIIEAN
ncbi:MG2 domain-containing protein [Saprospiraceae bacterium]|nr:MG2 domain-containing protein [Saprospiraceae bacterium]